MKQKYKASHSFSNGTEYEMFMENYCYRCKHYVDWTKGIPCPIEDKISLGSIDRDVFPIKELVETYDDNNNVVEYHRCLKFEESEDTE